MSKDVFSTPRFTAKEILQGKRPDFTSDLFSLGVLEKTLLTFSSSKENHSLHQRQTDHSALEHPPQHRKIKNFIFRKEDQKSLSRKVLSILDQQKTSLIATRPISKNNRNKISSFWHFIVICFLGITASGMNQKTPSGSVSIRSHQWLYIKIGNKEGFTPFSSGPLPSGHYTLYWKTSNKQNFRTIVLKPGDHILLTDKDLRID